jgi:uncharacterized protein involved in outer membrane biogenesis
MTRFRRIALWFTGVLAFLLVTGFVWLWFGNAGVFKPQLERWVSERTGREFVIEGRFDVNIGGETVIVAEGIRFQNADWSETRDMLAIGYFEVRIDTSSMFGAPLTIELVKLNDVELILQQPASGDPNWVFVPRPAAASPEQGDDSGVLDVIVRKIDADDIRVVYESPERTGPLDLRVTTLRQQHRDDDFLELMLDGALGDRKFDIRAVAGTWDALLAGKDVDYEIEGQLDTFYVSSKGTVDDVASPRRPSLTLAASGPDINDLLRVLKLQEGGSGAIDLAGSLQPTEDGPMLLDIAGRLGQMSIDASGSLSDLRSVEQFDVTVRASSPNLSRVLALFGFEGVREAPFTIDLDASRQEAMLTIERAHLEFADTTFDLTARLPGFPSLDAGSATLKITGSDFAKLRELLRLPGAADGPFSLGLGLDSDAQGEEIVRMALTSTLANIEAKGRIANEKGYVGSELDFTIRSDSLARVGQAYGLATLPDLPLTARGSFAVEEDLIRVRGPVTAEIENTRVWVEGSIARTARLEGSSLSVGIKAPDLASLAGYFAPAEPVPPLRIDLEGEVSLRGDGIRFSNVRGSLGQSSVNAGGVLNLAPLLAGSEFRLEASGPAFEELVEHLPNFEVRAGGYDLSGGLVFDGSAVQLKAIELSRDLGDARADVTVGLSQPETLIDFDVSARGQSVRSMLPSLGDFDLEDAPFSVTARGGLRGAGLTLARFDVAVGDATVAARGTVDLALGDRSTDFEFDLKVPNLAGLGLLKQRRPREQSLAISAKLRGDRETVRIDNLVARLGDSDLRGSLRLQKGDIPNISLELQSDSISLAPLLEEAALDYDTAPKFDDGRLIPDIEIPFDAMAEMNASVTVDIGALHRETLQLNAIVLNAELQDGALYLSEARFKASDGWFQARAALEPVDGAGRAMLAARARDLRIGLVERGAGTTTNTDLDINIEASGTDLRALAGSSNGVLYLDMREFTIPNNTFLRRLYGDLLNEIVDTINPFAKTDDETSVECVVLPVEINDGALAVNPEALVQTDKIRIVSDASINLQSEKIEMTFRTTPKKGLTISAGEILNPFVMVVGTLAAPRLAVDAKGTLISGGAAVATGGLSILARATWDRLVRSKDPCETAAQQALEVLQVRFADLPSP